MSPDPEALTQLARLLGDTSLRSATQQQAQAAIEAGLPQLVDGLVAEAAASDDVIDRDSAREFLQRRLNFFHDLLSDEQSTRLLAALWAKIDAW